MGSIKVSGCDDIHIHQEWKDGSAQQGKDIGLIIVRDQKQIDKLSAYTQKMVAKIPAQISNGYCCSESESLIAIGYGLDDDLQPPTDTLERIELDFHSTSECLKMMNEYFGREHRAPYNADDCICASGDGVEVDTCQGDSGGPLFRMAEDSRVEVVGVVSFGLNGYYPKDNCNGDHPHDLTLPAFYTNVGQFSEWIESTISNESAGSCEHVGTPSVPGKPTKSTEIEIDWPLIAAVAGTTLFICSMYCMYMRGRKAH